MFVLIKKYSSRGSEFLDFAGLGGFSSPGLHLNLHCLLFIHVYIQSFWADFTETSHKQSLRHLPLPFFSGFNYLNSMTSSAVISNFRTRPYHDRKFGPFCSNLATS